MLMLGVEVDKGIGPVFSHFEFPQVAMEFNRDLDAANLRPALGHHDGCGKQTPSDSILFIRTNLLYVPDIEM